jgi:hypothetical protein
MIQDVLDETKVRFVVTNLYFFPFPCSSPFFLSDNCPANEIFSFNRQRISNILQLVISALRKVNYETATQSETSRTYFLLLSSLACCSCYFYFLFVPFFLFSVFLFPFFPFSLFPFFPFSLFPFFPFSLFPFFTFSLFPFFPFLFLFSSPFFFLFLFFIFTFPF